MGIEQIPNIDEKREKLDKERAKLESKEYISDKDLEEIARIEKEHKQLSEYIKGIDEKKEGPKEEPKPGDSQLVPEQLAPEQQPQPERTQEPQPTQQTEKPPEKTLEELLEADIDAAKKILDDKSLDFQGQVELLKGIEQHLSKVLNVSPNKINLRQLTKMTPEELSEWLNEGSPEKQLERIIKEIEDGKIIPGTFLRFISTPGASKSISKILDSLEFQEGIKKPENQNKLKAVIEKFQKFISKEKEIPKPEVVEKAKEFIKSEEKKGKESIFQKMGGWNTVGGIAGFSLMMFLILIFLGEFKLLEKATGIEIGGEGKGKGKK